MASAKIALNPNVFKGFELALVKSISHDSRLFRFKLDSPNTLLGTTVASCLLARAPGLDGKPAIRAYTPTTLPDVPGYFDLVVKIYANGNLSRHFGTLKAGDMVEMKGPISKIPVTPNMKNAIGMIAGGTGITPMYQVIQQVLSNSDDHTKLALLYGNKTKDDILLKDELDTLAKKHSDRLSVCYLVDKAESGWTGLTGLVTAELIKAHMPPPTDDNLIFVCGPPAMMAAVSGPKKGPADQGVVSGALGKLGYTLPQVYKF